VPDVEPAYLPSPFLDWRARLPIVLRESPTPQVGPASHGLRGRDVVPLSIATGPRRHCASGWPGVFPRHPGSPALPLHQTWPVCPHPLAGARRRTVCIHVGVVGNWGEAGGRTSLGLVAGAFAVGAAGRLALRVARAFAVWGASLVAVAVLVVVARALAFARALRSGHFVLPARLRAAGTGLHARVKRCIHRRVGPLAHAGSSGILRMKVCRV